MYAYLIYFNNFAGVSNYYLYHFIYLIHKTNLNILVIYYYLFYFLIVNIFHWQYTPVFS